jgi:hypothetical protein
MCVLRRYVKGVDERIILYVLYVLSLWTDMRLLFMFEGLLLCNQTIDKVSDF